MIYKYIKRILDIISSLLAIILLSPLLGMLAVIGAFEMKGNPFFTQERPGKDEKIFELVKFRTMTDAKDESGELLSDAERLTKYGKFLRNTSLDELPELFNILKGDMSVIGPRPLLVQYLPYYTEKEKHRHDVRPGLTGLAQVNGRNSLDWEHRFECDVEYVENLSFFSDVKILLKTIQKVIQRSDVAEDTNETEGNFAEIRAKQLKENGALND